MIGIALSGCAGTRHYVSMMQMGGTIRVDTSDDPSYDYKVSIKTTGDRMVRWDLDEKEIRQETVNLMFGENCREVLVVDDRFVETGALATADKPIGIYVMKVKCIKKEPLSTSK